MDKAWNDVHKDRVWGRYPPEELVRFISKNFQQPVSEPPPLDGLSYLPADMSKFKALDLGCGIGACTWYLAREGFRTIGLDGSIEGLKRACVLLEKENLKAQLVRAAGLSPGTGFGVHAPGVPLLVHGDFLVLPFKDNYFDVTVDVCSIQHNLLEHMQNTLVEVCRVLKKGGLHFSMMVTRDSWGDGRGRRLEPGTYTDCYAGPYKGVGKVHFTRLPEIQHLFTPFSWQTTYWLSRCVRDGEEKVI